MKALRYVQLGLSTCIAALIASGFAAAFVPIV